MKNKEEISEEIDSGQTDTRYEFRKGFIDSDHPNTGQYYKGAEIKEPLVQNKITKVDGVNAYSQQASLYKGLSAHQPFHPQEGLDTRYGTMPRGTEIMEPPRYSPPRNKSGFKPQGPYSSEGRTPKVSPLPSGIQDSTTWANAIHTTYRDLKAELNTGIGARTNKYVLELEVPISGSPSIKSLNILCQSVSFPQRSMTSASVWRFGRKYNLRGETNFGDTCTIEFVDDSLLSVRRSLDRWFIDIDDSKLQDEGLTGLYRAPLEKLKGVGLSGREMNAKMDWAGSSRSYNTGFSKEYNTSTPGYQTDIRVFQLDQVGNKISGYLMQNAFISEISQIEYRDDKENELTKFTAGITFSEFLPLSIDHNTLYQAILG